MLVLSNNNGNLIPACEAREDRVYVITSWLIPSYIGNVVIRHKNALIVVGGGDTKYWGNITSIPTDCVLRELQDGETLIVKNGV